MLYGVKCSKCGLTQLPKDTCKACGAVLEAPSEAPPKASPRPLPKSPSTTFPRKPIEAFSNTPPRVPPEATLDMTLDVPPPDPFWNPSGAASDGRTSRKARNCSECGLVYFEDELIRFGDAWVCGKCKPLFVQKLREGVTVAGEMVYAGFWIRVGAKFIDGIILTVAGFVLGLLIGFSVRQPMVSTVTQKLLSSALSLAYAIYFVGKYSATPGKMACGLKVLRPDGEKISYARACGRFFAELLSSMILCIGYIMVAFDDEKRALHDRICDTRVVRTVKA